MIPFNGYSIYQAERAQSERERRLADAQAGELAADLSRLRHLLGRPGRALRDLTHSMSRALSRRSNPHHPEVICAKAPR